jgi:hypothetical protein
MASSLAEVLLGNIWTAAEGNLLLETAGIPDELDR